MKIFLVTFFFLLFYSANGEISTDPNDVSIYIYNNNSDILSYQKLEFKDEATKKLKKAHITTSAPFKVLIHGFLQNGSTFEFPQDVKNAYLEQKKKYNIIVVDWGLLANPSSFLTMGPSYITAADNVQIVAKKVSKILVALKEKNKIKDYDSIHIIGFSLGAHIASVIGYNIAQESGGKKIGRITGLDPAGVLFSRYMRSEDDKLDKDDANFVDVIHTDAGVLGYNGDIGHIDFYVNGGGPPQPNCPLVELYPLPTWCSHKRATQYFSRSIRLKEPEKGCKCSSWLWYRAVCKDACKDDEEVFGEYINHSARGRYYIEISNHFNEDTENNV